MGSPKKKKIIKKTKTSKKTKKKKATKKAKQKKKPKIATKKISKKAKKRPKKKSRKKHISRYEKIHNLEGFYKIVNRVQIKKDIAPILMSDIDLAPMCRNVLKDSNLEFTERITKRGCYFTITPNFEEVVVEVNVEELEDEFLEDGQIF
jgi:hypothetical protein